MMFSWRSLVAYLAVVGGCVPALWFVIIPYFSSTIRSIDSNVRGLSERIASGKTVHLVVVHGIGGQCIGYSDRLVEGLVNNLALTRKSKPFHEHGHDFKNCPAATDIDTGDAGGPQMELLHRQQEFCRRLYEYDQSCQEMAVPMPEASGPRKFGPTFGFVKTSDYVDSQSAKLHESVKFRVYEIVWDPSTRWAKQTYVQYLDQLDDNQRTLINRQGKWKLINEAITDAVLYLGAYKTRMQFPVVMGFCKVISRQLDTTDNFFRCTPEDVTDNFPETNHVAVISHSLGTRMVFDTLAQMVDLEKMMAALEYPIGNLSRDTLRNVTRAFRDGVGTVYAFANQIPLIEMGLIQGRDDFINIRAENKNRPPPPADLGTGFQMFLNGRSTNPRLAGPVSNYNGYGVRPLEVVAFTDHDDFLSFNLKCWYYLNVLRFNKSIIDQRSQYPDDKVPSEYKFDRCDTDNGKKFWDLISEKLTITNVIVRLGFNLGIVSNPYGAHSNYWSDREVHRLIACGASDTPSRGRAGEAIKLARCQ